MSKEAIPEAQKPKMKDGSYVFGVCHIFASFNDTFIVSSSDHL